ncbi:hypothetical protein CYLTODRAFT_450327 [Cylindrobasidium torrendii FP15055 ss-10]|uniref:RlpA-like protein double-psi beta-barrel domain-containing protein n=1 Tax=Cylindrobasidium torrendii FP15055 ss-10 TaxID=1314674 RepID=A0A0D7BP77_9AGAR|nr:hypothetical protein CYLTODRAFT_450327 [Cylindrobasidium torrendii FP15055 ss-10]
MKLTSVISALVLTVLSVDALQTNEPHFGRAHTGRGMRRLSKTARDEWGGDDYNDPNAGGDNGGYNDANNGGGGNVGGHFGTATFYTQNGVQGSCGNWHSDQDFIVAIHSDIMDANRCGQTISVCNKANGKCHDAQVQDTCPTCNRDSPGPGALGIDLSVALFDSLASESDGVFDATYSY